jgi:hypothetical protein
MFLDTQPLPGTYELYFAGMNWGFDGINQGVKILKKFSKNLQKVESASFKFSVLSLILSQRKLPKCEELKTQNSKQFMY